MKIVHAADLHIDSPLKGLRSYTGAPEERIRGATRSAFRRVIDLCLAEDARFLVLAGDVFDNDWKDINTGLFFAHELARLREIGCRVLLLRGNHDFELTRALDHADHVHEFGADGTRVTHAFEREGVVFHGVSYPEREVRESLLPRYPAAMRDLLNVGVLHTNATGSADHASYAPCTPNELAAKAYQYWALGHVHRHAVLLRDPWVVYPGNTQGRHANEPGEKGCVLLHVDGARVLSVDFRATDVMRWYREDLALSAEDDVDELRQRVRARLDAIVAANGDRLAAVRLIVRGACRAHASICRDRERVVQQLRADAFEYAGALWLEKIELHTAPEVAIEQLRDAKGLVAELLRDVDRFREDDADLFDLVRVLEPIKKKLAAESEDLDLHDPEFLRRVLDQAEALLAQQLTDQGGSG